MHRRFDQDYDEDRYNDYSDEEKSDSDQSNPSSELKLSKKSINELWSSRRKMAWVALWSIILPTLFILIKFSDAETIDKIGGLMSWYYLSLASITGSYFGFKAWATIRGK